MAEDQNPRQTVRAGCWNGEPPVLKWAGQEWCAKDLVGLEDTESDFPQVGSPSATTEQQLAIDMQFHPSSHEAHREKLSSYESVQNISLKTETSVPRKKLKFELEKSPLKSVNKKSEDPPPPSVSGGGVDLLERQRFALLNMRKEQKSTHPAPNRAITASSIRPGIVGDPLPKRAITPSPIRPGIAGDELLELQKQAMDNFRKNYDQNVVRPTLPNSNTAPNMVELQKTGMANYSSHSAPRPVRQQGQEFGKQTSSSTSRYSVPVESNSLFPSSVPKQVPSFTASSTVLNSGADLSELQKAAIAKMRNTATQPDPALNLPQKQTGPGREDRVEFQKATAKQQEQQKHVVRLPSPTKPHAVEKDGAGELLELQKVALLGMKAISQEEDRKEISSQIKQRNHNIEGDAKSISPFNKVKYTPHKDGGFAPHNCTICGVSSSSSSSFNLEPATLKGPGALPQQLQKAIFFLAQKTA